MLKTENKFLDVENDIIDMHLDLVNEGGNTMKKNPEKQNFFKFQLKQSRLGHVSRYWG